MVKFYTHYDIGTRAAKDEEGQHFPGFDEARRSAVRSAGHMVAEEMNAGRHQVSLSLHIEDEEGVRLGTVSVAATLASLN